MSWLLASLRGYEGGANVASVSYRALLVYHIMTRVYFDELKKKEKQKLKD